MIDRLLGRRDQVLYLGLGAVAAGFIVMGLGWLGAARKDTVPEQFPYLISGGLVGLGLVFVGSALLLIRALERTRERWFEEIPGTAAAVGGEAPTNSGRRAGRNHELVAGASSYHLASCRLVKQRAGAEAISLEAAKARDLTACRVCQPPV